MHVLAYGRTDAEPPGQSQCMILVAVESRNVSPLLSAEILAGEMKAKNSPDLDEVSGLLLVGFGAMETATATESMLIVSKVSQHAHYGCLYY
jgi:hypothetical protein